MKRFIFTAFAICLSFACFSCDSADGEPQNRLADDSGYGWNCPELTFSSIAWTDVTPLEQSPAELFGNAAGTCTAPFILDAANSGLSPQSGETEVTVSLVMDETSAQLGIASGTDKELAQWEADECATVSVSAQGTATVETADGLFASSGTVTLTTSGANPTFRIRMSVPFEEFNESFTYTPYSETDEATELIYHFSPPGSDSCSGEVDLHTHANLDDGIAMDSMGVIANWSDTGCDDGEDAVNIDEAYGTPMMQQISEIWTAVQISGHWDDNTTDTLHISATVPNPVGCRTNGSMEIILPATITYYTESDALMERTVIADSFSVSIDDSGTLYSSSLWLDDHIACDSETTLDSYGAADCSTLSGVTIQLGVQWTDDDALYVGDGGLFVYEYNADSTPDGQASNVRELSL
ncbi:MAG: hypothetical protein JXX29_16770 [Deltaproteobacteria bacterium]|nr:hypothetical protein [Deltaproteobacteria bacterium]MBN2673339.1 hypothetical protein [Deltaproteobacteria bacterium]